MPRMKSLALTAVVASSLCAAARADVLHVPKDFATIQLAIDAAQAGDEIVIAAGSYAESLLIDSKSDLRLHGQGKVTLTGLPGGLAHLVIQAGTDIEIEKLRMEGSTGVGVSISGASSGVTLRHCRVSGSAGDGIAVEDSDHILLEHVDVSGTGNDGLRVLQTDFLTVRHGTFTDIFNYAIDVVDGTSHLVEHVKISGAGEDGIAIRAQASIIRKNKVSDVSLAGISANGNGVLIEDNRVLPPSAFGIWLQGGTCIARDNRIVGAEFYGVDIFDGTHQVLDNRIVQAGSAGIRVSGPFGAPGQVLADNRVLESLDDGILITAGSDGCTLVHNRVVAPGGDGFSVIGQDAQIVDNRVTGAGEDGMHLEGAGAVVAGNRAHGSGLFDLLDTQGTSTYLDNDFGTESFP